MKKILTMKTEKDNKDYPKFTWRILRGVLKEYPQDVAGFYRDGSKGY